MSVHAPSLALDVWLWNAAGLGKRRCNSAQLLSYLKSSEFDWNGHGRNLREIGRGLEDIGRECGGAGQEGM